jgi:DNA-binding CsgD family transcriptional regulator
MVRFVVDREFRYGLRLSRLRAAHRAYWVQVARRGVALDGGEWEEGCGETLVVRGTDRETLQAMLSGDPYAREQLVLTTSIRGLGDLPGVEAGPRQGVERPPVAAERDPLSAHECRIAHMMLDGLTNRQIAQEFAVSPRAVEQHITRIYRKLSISRRAQLAVALQNVPTAVAVIVQGS